MIREEDKSEWFKFLAHAISNRGRRSGGKCVMPASWRCRMSRNGIRSLTIVVLLMIPAWVAAFKFVASLWEVFHG
jgi:hypothetical protein